MGQRKNPIETNLGGEAAGKPVCRPKVSITIRFVC